MSSSFTRTGNKYTVHTSTSKSFIPVRIPRNVSSTGISITLENGRSESGIWLGNCFLDLFSGPCYKRLNTISKLSINKLSMGISNQKYNYFEKFNIASINPSTALPEATSLNNLVSRYTWDNKFLYKTKIIPREFNFEYVRNRAYYNILKAAQNVTDTDSACNFMKELNHDIHISNDLLAEVLAKALVIKGLSHVE